MFRGFGKKRGLTLIELLVVIAIIGILATIIMVKLGDSQAKSRDARRLADIDNLNGAVILYHQAQGNYDVCPLAGESDICSGVDDYSKLVPTGFAPAQTPSRGVMLLLHHDHH